MEEVRQVVAHREAEKEGRKIKKMNKSSKGV